MSTFIAELAARSMIAQRSEGLDDTFIEDNAPALYAGFDPTACSLHVGHLPLLITLERYRARGGQIVIVIGGATGLIGDPSGKDAERALLERDDVLANTMSLKNQLELFFLSRPSPGPDPIIVSNVFWWRRIDAIDFLRDIGKNFSVNTMLNRESVRGRIENRKQGISFTEFAYQIIQAYDFHHLNQEHGVGIQIGGSDQWGNMVAGLDLIRRCDKDGARQAHALALPLLTDSQGRKFGKTEGRPTFLSASMTGPLDFYQFWMRLPDDQARTLLFQLCDLEAEDMDEALSAEPHLRIPQHTLADQMTRLVHGDAAAAQAREASEVLYGDRTDASSLPVITCAQGETARLIDVAAHASTGLSRGQARRLIWQGGVRVRGEKLTTPELDLTDQINQPGPCIAQIGKKLRVVLQFG